MTEKNKHQISWEAAEFAEYEKGGKWYTIFLAIGVLILAYAIWQKDFLMFLTFFILLIATYLFAKRKPKKILITLTGKGITLNENEYSYGMIKTFWILYDPPEVMTLNFETTQVINRELVIQLEDADPNEIREFLSQYLPEDFDREESYPDKFLRRIKF